MDALLSDDSLSLDGLEVSLPSAEEQAIRRDKAFKNLQAYVEACGGTLPEGWDCALRFRITSRRHGRQGVTTDNYYYSPCGKTLRTHKQVAECLGLQPLSKEQTKQQHSNSDEDGAPPEQFSIVSVTILESGCPSSSTAGPSSPSKSGKRSHSSMTATDTDTAAAVESPDRSQLQQQQPAGSAPAALAGSASQAVSCSSLDPAQRQCCSAGLSAPAAVQQPAAKRTKAALAAKYNSTASCSMVGPSLAAAAGVGAAAAASSAMSCQTSCEGGGAVCSAVCSLAAAAGSGYQQTPEPLLHPAPAQPAASSSGGSRVGSSSKAVSSRPVVLPAAQQAAQPQQRRRAVQPVPKPWKPRAQPAWRAKLRELASAAVLAEELGAAAAAPSGADDSTC